MSNKNIASQEEIERLLFILESGALMVSECGTYLYKPRALSGWLRFDTHYRKSWETWGAHIDNEKVLPIKEYFVGKFYGFLMKGND